MAYTVLARKYRSQTFDDVIGQDPVARTLKNAIKTGRVAHAFLFVGTRGVGKTTMARVLAKALNCLSVDEPTTEPCCKCESCVAVNNGEDIDVVEIDGASNNGVDQIRQLRENAVYRPARSRYKIYIIDEVHMLSVGAFNALLKILEEPPAHVKFIFATTEPNKVLPTIQSRCQRFDFSNIGSSFIAKHLKSVLDSEQIKYQEDLVLQVAKMANGSMRDALSLIDRLISAGSEPLSVELLEEFLGCANSDKIIELASKVADSDAAGTLNSLNDLLVGGLSEVQVVDALIDCMRDLMVLKSAGADSELLIVTAEQRNVLGSLAEKFDIAALVYNITTLEKLRWTIKNSESAKALLEASLLRFALSEHFLNVDQLLSKMSSGQMTAATSPKKKLITASEKPVTCEKPQQASESTAQIDIPKLADIESLKNSWPEVLKAIAQKSSAGTAALLNSCQPVSFAGGILKLEFKNEAAMKMVSNCGKMGVIESALAEITGTSVQVEMGASQSVSDGELERQKAQTSSQKRNEIINDPAVRTILKEFEATVNTIDDGS